MDIAIDTCQGETFAHQVQAYLQKKGQLGMGHISTIAVNPEKSKHLETATAKLFVSGCLLENV